MYGDSMQAMVPQYLEASMEAFRKNQQQFQDAMQGAFSGGPFAEIAKRNMEMFGAATSAFKGATSEKKASTAAEEKDDEIARSEEHTSELKSLMRHSTDVLCMNTKKKTQP